MRQKYHFATDNGILIWDVTSILIQSRHFPPLYWLTIMMPESVTPGPWPPIWQSLWWLPSFPKIICCWSTAITVCIKPERLVLKIFRAIIFLRNSSSILLCISDHLNMSTLLPVFHKNQLLPFRLFIIDTKTVPGIVSSVSVPERLILLYFFSVYFTICTSMLPERKPSASNVI